MKIVTVVGARPQFIKAAAVSREISKYPDITEIIVHTGQHFDNNMSEVFFDELQIPTPHYNLNINSTSHGAMTGRMLEEIEKVLFKEMPDYVLVYGDTNSTLAGALAAQKLHIKVVHVEAGLRSFNMKMPEEINRIITDRISNVLCCPTRIAVDNLMTEGFDQFPCEIVQTGDVMQDAAIYYSALSAEKSHIIKKLRIEGKKFLLCTVHRAENTDDMMRLTNIFNAFREIGSEYLIVLPLHPRTQKILANSDLHGIVSDRQLKIIDPVGYFDMIELLKKSTLVMTDSGGLQKEAFFFHKPCVTLRDETEWIELVDKGFNILAGADHAKIVTNVTEMLNKDIDYNQELYGNGTASSNIIRALRK